MKLSLRRKRIAGWVVLVGAGIWILSACAARAESSKESHKPAHKKVAKGTARRSVSSRRYAGRRRSSFRYRLARMQPQPERIVEIQQALIREGYLKQEASGKWDDATREAMRNYQAANGFEATGLPEAKTLMKLGLGPHPLSEDADPSVAGNASATPPSVTRTGSAAQAAPDPR